MIHMLLCLRSYHPSWLSFLLGLMLRRILKITPQVFSSSWACCWKNSEKNSQVLFFFLSKKKKKGLFLLLGLVIGRIQKIMPLNFFFFSWPRWKNSKNITSLHTNKNFSQDSLLKCEISFHDSWFFHREPSLIEFYNAPSTQKLF